MRGRQSFERPVALGVIDVARGAAVCGAKLLAGDHAAAEHDFASRGFVAEAVGGEAEYDPQQSRVTCWTSRWFVPLFRHTIEV